MPKLGYCILGQPLRVLLERDQTLRLRFELNVGGPGFLDCLRYKIEIITTCCIQIRRRNHLSTCFHRLTKNTLTEIAAAPDLLLARTG